MSVAAVHGPLTGSASRARGPAPDLTVIIPAHNEAAYIARALDEIHDTLHGLRIEVVVVDDRSTDATSAEVARWTEAHPRATVVLQRLSESGGKGAAVRDGILVSTGRRVAYIDADLDIPAKELRRLYGVACSDAVPVIVGSKRHICWQTAGVPLARRAISVTFSRLVHLLFRLPVQDTQTGLKLFDGAWVRGAFAGMQTTGFLFDVELLATAQRSGLEIREIRVEYTPQRDNTRIGVRHVARCVVDLARIWYSCRITSRAGHGDASVVEQLHEA